MKIKISELQQIISDEIENIKLSKISDEQKNNCAFLFEDIQKYIYNIRKSIYKYDDILLLRKYSIIIFPIVARIYNSIKHLSPDVILQEIDMNYQKAENIVGKYPSYNSIDNDVQITIKVSDIIREKYSEKEIYYNY